VTHCLRRGAHLSFKWYCSSTVVYCTVLYCTVLSTVLHSTLQYSHRLQAKPPVCSPVPLLLLPLSLGLPPAVPWPAAVAPVFYAHLAAAHCRKYLDHEDFSDAGSDSTAGRNQRMQAAPEELRKVMGNLQDKMFFS